MIFLQEIEIYYTDQTSETKELINVLDVPFKRMAYFPAGALQLTVNNLADNSKKWYKYDFYLKFQTDEVIATERFTYRRRITDALEKYLLYETSSGAFRTLRLTGRTSTGVVVQKKEIQKILPTIYAAIDNTKISQTQRHDDVFGVSTGFLKKSEIESLVDFVRSENMFLQQAGIRTRVTLKAGSYQLTLADDFLYSLNFDLEKAFPEFNYSNVK